MCWEHPENASRDVAKKTKKNAAKKIAAKKIDLKDLEAPKGETVKGGVTRDRPRDPETASKVISTGDIQSGLPGSSPT